MEIIISERKENLEIVKNTEDELKIFLLNFKIIIAGVILINFICFMNAGLLAVLFGCFLSFFPLFFLYRQNKYIYCNEILRIETTENIVIKFTFKNNLLYEKKIETKDIKKIYFIKKKQFHSIFRKKVENKILAEPFEQRRRLKILLSNGEIYSWGRDINDEDRKRVEILLKNYFNEIKIEYLLDF